MRTRNSRLIRPIVLVGLIAVLAQGCVFIPRRSFPKERGTVSIEGLKAPVEVVRDKYGVPHIYAQTVEDLFFAQGYVQAQDRFWQMELYRRAGSGRLAELFGKDLLGTDIFYRTLGFRRVAEEEYAQLEGEPKRVIDAYAAGVTAYIHSRKPTKLALAYTLLKIMGVEAEVDDWTPVDSFVFTKMMAETLNANMTTERLALDAILAVGLGRVADLVSPYQVQMPYVISDEEMGLGSSAGAAPVQRLTLAEGRSSGSNSWAISGELTASGDAILANDTHLGAGMPSIYHEAALHIVDGSGNPVTREGENYHVRGVCFPGVPCVIIGHNARIAWGITFMGGDAQDLYTERINPNNPDQYEVNGRWVDMEIIYERMEIEGEDEPYILRVRKTRHGPVISDHGSYARMTSFFLSPEVEFPENLDLTAITLKWTALEPQSVWPAFVPLNQAENFDDFREALRHWASPATSIVYADVDGNIGYQVPPPIPIRKSGDGRLPSPGWTDDYEWKGYVPFDELPYSYNPEKGYIVACNNPPVSENYRYLIGTSHSFGYRAKRAADMIEADEDGITIEDVKKMQANAADIWALELVSYLEGLDLSQKDWLELEKEEELAEEETEKEREKREEAEAEELEAFEAGRERLLEWDGGMNMDSGEAALYGFFWQRFVAETFKDQYPEARWPGVNYERLMNTLHYILPEPDNPWWDDAKTPDVTETRDDILVRAFRRGYRDAAAELGDKVDKWEWGKVHQVEFREMTMGESGIGFVEKLFNRGPVPVRGSEETLSVAYWEPEEPFDVVHIPAHRQVIDMGNVASSFMMHVPGQSGHPKHRHYDDLIEPWRQVEYHPTLFDREDIKGGSVLRLKPAG